MNKKRADDVRPNERIVINGMSRKVIKVLVMPKSNEIQIWTETTCSTNFSKLYQILVCGKGEMVQYNLNQQSKKFN